MSSVPDTQQDDSPLNWRSQVSELRSRLQKPISDIDTLLDLVLGPLEVLELWPASSSIIRESSSSSKSHKKALGLEYAKKQDALRQPRWITDAQITLLKQVIPDWEEVLGKQGILDDVLQQWFSPRAGTENERDGDGKIMALEANQMSQAAVVVSALASFSEMMSGIGQGEKTSRQTKILMPRVVASFLDQLSLPQVASYCQSLTSRAQQELVWSQFVRQLLSLPDRLAAFFEGEVTDNLSATRIHSLVGSQLGALVSSKNLTLESKREMLVRLIRVGWFQDDQRWKEDSLNIWPSLLRAQALRIGNGTSDHGTNDWAIVVGSLNDSEQSSLVASLLSSLDKYCLQARGIDTFVQPSESAHPGLEGKAFSSQAAWRDSLLLSHLIEPFISISKGSKPMSDRIDEDDNDDDALDEIPMLLSRILLQQNVKSTNRSWSPAMTRILVHLFDVHGDPAAVASLLSRAIETWNKQAKTSSWEEEAYWATLIALLISILPLGDKSIEQIAIMPDFIHGVSRHLEHLSPAVRRLGMLLGEIVSERTGKSLSFGKKAWDGKGEGREEARVLRALAISFPHRVKTTIFDTQATLQALQLDLTDNETHRDSAIPALRSKPSPSRTRRLPERRPAPQRNLLIQEIGDDSKPLSKPVGSDALPSLLNISSANGKIGDVSDGESETSSSSESDSSKEEDQVNDVKAPLEEEGKAFGMGTPSNKKRPGRPIYVSELAPLLRQNERDAVHIGLKFSTPLIERKASYGHEVHENAIDLTLALLSLNNNFSLKYFEQRRLSALTALIVATPDRVGACLAEQYFHHQYSMSQRITILNTLAFGAYEMTTGKKASTSKKDEREKQGRVRGLNANSLAQDLAQMAMTQAREDGQQRVPEYAREQSLLINKPMSKPSSAPSSLAFKTGEARVDKSARYLSIASTCFIFPLVNRQWAHMQDSSYISTVRQSSSGGRGIIDMPFMTGAFLDTLAVLAYNAQNEQSFRSTIVPELAQLVLAMTSRHLAAIANSSQRAVPIEEDNGDNESGGGSRSTIMGAACSLILVLIDACWHLDSGASLARQQARLLTELQHWAAAIFESTNGAAQDRSTGLVDRAGRTSAALLLRINEIHENQRKPIGR